MGVNAQRLMSLSSVCVCERDRNVQTQCCNISEPPDSLLMLRVHRVLCIDVKQRYRNYRHTCTNHLRVSASPCCSHCVCKPSPAFFPSHCFCFICTFFSIASPGRHKTSTHILLHHALLSSAEIKLAQLSKH